MGEWVVRLIEQSGYLGVAFLMFLETIFPPIPSEVIMPVAGIAAARGNLTLWGVIASGTAGAMLGNTVWYLAARALGLLPFRAFIDRYGTFFVFMGRMLPTVRSLVSVPAGLLKMRFKTFVIASTLGTAGWTTMLAFAGYKLRENFEEIDSWLGPISNAILLTLALGYLWRVVRYKPKH